MRRRLLAAGLVAGAAILVGAFLVWPRGATPVTEAEALDDFRARSTGRPDETDGSAPGGGDTPEPGVYTYDSSGRESVKLGVLPTEERSYPETMTVVVVADGAGCFTATLNLLDQHTEDTTYCVDGGRLAIEEHTKRQEVGALRPTADMTCEPGVLYDPERSSTGLDCSLSLSGGPAQLSAELRGTVEVTDGEAVEVGGDEIDAILIDVTYDITGDLSGTWYEALWLAPETFLPLRIQRDLELSGLATFTEHSELVLASTSPRR